MLFQEIASFPGKKRPEGHDGTVRGRGGRSHRYVSTMNANLSLPRTWISWTVALGVGSVSGLAKVTEHLADAPSATDRIRWSQLGARLGSDFQGDALPMIPAADGARSSAIDAAGKEATRRPQVASDMPDPETLTVKVNSAEPLDPVRMDLTVSDANWSSMGGIPGVDGIVSEAVVDGSGNLYIGGEFHLAGSVIANHVAQWNGSAWTALGSGLVGSSPHVSALAVLGSDLYAGGAFSFAGGKVSAYIARAYLPALPTLSVSRSGEYLTVSWPAMDTDGFVLEQAGPIADPAGWATHSATVTDVGVHKSLTLSATNSSQAFRLRRP